VPIYNQGLSTLVSRLRPRKVAGFRCEPHSGAGPGKFWLKLLLAQIDRKSQQERGKPDFIRL